MSPGKECLGCHLLSRGQARPGLQEQTWAGREQEPDLSAWAGSAAPRPAEGAFAPADETAQGTQPGGGAFQGSLSES